MLIEEITEREAAWDPTSRRCPATNVEPSGWGTFAVRIRVGGGRRWSVGSFRTLRDAEAAATWARAMRDRQMIPVGAVIVVRPTAGRPPGSRSAD